MPTQGRSRIRQFLIGSVTAKVLHDSECPVLTGSHLEDTIDFPDFRAKSIICAVDRTAKRNCSQLGRTPGSGVRRNGDGDKRG